MMCPILVGHFFTVHCPLRLVARFDTVLVGHLWVTHLHHEWVTFAETKLCVDMPSQFMYRLCSELAYTFVTGRGMSMQ